MARESACQSCGATIFPEQIDSGLARYEQGKLMCVHCVAEFERQHDLASASGAGHRLDPIALRDEEDGESPARGAARGEPGGSGLGMPAGGSGLGLAAGRAETRQYQRELDPAACGATRCRTFHCKLNDSAIEFMNHSVNQWLDEHRDITVKFATSTLGVFEGKSKEQNLILTVFY